MCRQTRTVAKHLQSILLGIPTILLILSAFAVNADTSKTITSDVEYKRYEWPTDPEGRKYHRFLRAHPPEGLFYDTRQKVIANIDDTPEKETIVSIVADSGHDAFAGNWVQAFLLILDETETDGFPKKKAFFKFLGLGTPDLDVPAKAVKVQKPPFVFNPGSDKGHGAPFTLVDLTGDGVLDVWFNLGEAIAVISFQNGEFKEIFSSYTVHGLLPDAEYVDLDNDGT